jgi:hypothetical protein
MRRLWILTRYAIIIVVVRRRDIIRAHRCVRRARRAVYSEIKLLHRTQNASEVRNIRGRFLILANGILRED